MIKPSDIISEFKKAVNESWGYIYGKTHDLWSKEKQAQYEKEYADDPDRQMSCQYGEKWAGHWVTDCSGLFKWAFKQHGGDMFHGSNTMWNDWCTAKGELKNGKRTDGKTLKPGSAVFTSNGNRHNHVGLFVGNGKVIEAKGTKAGVVYSDATDKRWTHWGELKGLDYSAETTPTPTPEPAKDEGYPTLRKGDKGKYVTLAQTKLIQKGYDLGKWGADGDFGSATEKAVREFQQDHELNVNGIICKSTWTELEKQGTNLYTVTIPSLPKFKAEALIRQYTGAKMTEEGR